MAGNVQYLVMYDIRVIEVLGLKVLTKQILE